MYLSHTKGKESAQRYGLAESAYCLMTNYIHLVVVPAEESSLSKALGRTHLMYAQYIHRLHVRLGHFWQNRFYSYPIARARWRMPVLPEPSWHRTKSAEVIFAPRLVYNPRTIPSPPNKELR